MSKTAEQLDLEFADPICSVCGGRDHDACGYDAELVAPVMSVAQAMTATIRHVVEACGWPEAKRRIPGLHTWDELDDATRDAMSGQGSRRGK